MNAWGIVLALLAGPAGAEGRHTVVPRDTLWDLAAHYYKDPFQWRRIAEANPAPDVEDPHWIYPGQVLRIPDVEGEPEAVAEAPPPAPVARPAPRPRRAARATVNFKPEAGTEGTVTLPESFSTRIPEGLVSAPPSNYRMIALPGWKPDGLILGFDGTEIMAAQGDSIDIELSSGEARVGDRFLVFRRTAPTEADSDKTALYLVKIGLISIKRPLEGGKYRATVLTSNDALQVGDLVKRGQ